MMPDRSPEHWYRRIWWIGGAAFLIGVAVGVREIRTERAPLPVASSIPRFEQDAIRLDHPLTGDLSPASLKGNLRLWLYSGRELAGPPLAATVQRPAFDGDTPWLKALIAEKIPRVPPARSIRMRGWISFSSPVTVLHLRSENGYRVRFRNALGAERRLVHWEDDVTWDFACGVAAEPGRYEIEVEYFSVGGWGLFEIWGTPEVQFDPQPEAPASPR
jgi:hypothetical protein